MKRYGPLDIVKILEFLPHRYPFLFVDKITEISTGGEGNEMLQVGSIVKGIKLATINEPYFTGHFPNMPITPLAPWFPPESHLE
jgi:3-hydroxymyristoyl/3-hydroxydecanoyl-(acyl carrier protein) dehydratase